MNKLISYKKIKTEKESVYGSTPSPPPLLETKSRLERDVKFVSGNYLSLLTKIQQNGPSG